MLAEGRSATLSPAIKSLPLTSLEASHATAIDDTRSEKDSYRCCPDLSNADARDGTHRIGLVSLFIWVPGTDTRVRTYITWATSQRQAVMIACNALQTTPFQHDARRRSDVDIGHSGGHVHRLDLSDNRARLRQTESGSLD